MYCSSVISNQQTYTHLQRNLRRFYITYYVDGVGPYKYFTPRYFQGITTIRDPKLTYRVEKWNTVVYSAVKCRKEILNFIRKQVIG